MLMMVAEAKGSEFVGVFMALVGLLAAELCLSQDLLRPAMQEVVQWNCSSEYGHVLMG